MKYSAAGQQGKVNTLSHFHGSSGYMNASYVDLPSCLLSSLCVMGKQKVAHD